MCGLLISQWLLVAGMAAVSAAVEVPQLVNSLGLGDISRVLNLGGGLSGLVEGGFDKLGYIPIGDALQRCEGKARYRVMSELNRLRAEGEKVFGEIEKDIEARCRGYVEYAGQQCQKRVESLAGRLQQDGRQTLSEAQAKCARETEELTNRTLQEEDFRLRRIGNETERRVRAEYEERGRREEVTIRAEFESRGKALQAKIMKDFERRGEEERTKIIREYTLRGELEAAKVELELRKKGEEEMVKIRTEFEERGKELEVKIRKEYEERGEIERKNIEKFYRDMGLKLQKEGEQECLDMLNKACEFVEPNSESENFCLDALFFTGDIDSRRKRY